MTKEKASTIKDVAREAGVSVSAVSKVFNKYGDIGIETQNKVFAAAKRLEYIPNQAARKLSSKHTKIIALILNEIKVERGVTMPLEILSGVSNYLEATDYEFVFYGTTSKKQAEKSLKQFCAEHSITGLLIQGLKTTDPYYKELANFSMPTVAIDLRIENCKIGTVSIDNESAAAEVTKRLRQAGYEKILFLNGTTHDEVSQKREAGYRSQVKEVLIDYAHFSEEKAMLQILDADLTGIDAIFAASDLMAIGVIKALRLRKKETSIAVVGFDDNVLASYVSPTLTTVRQDVKTMSESAVEDLLLQIEEKEVRHRLLPYEIIVRESANI
ncbi:regulatory protein, LacI [Streptococcus varani]|uniref:Regulatory protein, LacI n=1 Tax=Streptococcus varani TaxID=1608583 RepID=A0A0E4CT36_9STRE|nr:LacI family DNA-binding transcriptional regulator [Streptococcus varani]CQR25260.1 regulatory protein, LacI [Streptococcus varani]